MFNVKHLTMLKVQMHAGAMSKFLCTSTNTLTKARSLGQEKNMCGSGYPTNPKGVRALRPSRAKN